MSCVTRRRFARGLHAKILVLPGYGPGRTSCPRSHVRLPAIIASSTTGARCGRVSIALGRRGVTLCDRSDARIRPSALHLPPCFAADRSASFCAPFSAPLPFNPIRQLHSPGIAAVRVPAANSTDPETNGRARSRAHAGWPDFLRIRKSPGPLGILHAIRSVFRGSRETHHDKVSSRVLDQCVFNGLRFSRSIRMVNRDLMGFLFRFGAEILGGLGFVW